MLENIASSIISHYTGIWNIDSIDNLEAVDFSEMRLSPEYVSYQTKVCTDHALYWLKLLSECKQRDIRLNVISYEDIIHFDHRLLSKLYPSLSPPTIKLAGVEKLPYSSIYSSLIYRYEKDIVNSLSSTELMQNNHLNKFYQLIV